MEEGYIDLGFLQKQFLCCTPINKLKWNTANNGTIEYNLMSLEIQEKILNRTVNHDLVKKYPMKPSYQRAFLKFLINELEKSSTEVHDDLYNAYCLLVQLSDQQENATQYRHFVYNDDACTEAIILQESMSFVSLGTTGLCTWQAALGLAEWCLTNRKILAGKKILELGCGVGLTGLTILRNCKPKEYIFSDTHPAVLTMLCKNIVINHPSYDDRVAIVGSPEDDVKLEFDCNGVNVKTIRLPWEEINDSLTESSPALNPDIILAADVLYDDSCFDSLAGALRHLLRNDGTYAIIAATVRNVTTISKFLNLLGSYDLVFHEAQLAEKKFFVHVDDTPIRIVKIVKVDT